MKNFKILSFFLILVLILSISLQGCSPKETDIEENPENIIEGNEEESKTEKDNQEEENNIEDSNQEDISSEDKVEDTDSSHIDKDTKLPDEESKDKSPSEEKSEEDSIENKESSNNNKDEEVSVNSEEDKANNAIKSDESSEENIVKTEDSKEENPESENNKTEKTEKNLLKIQGNVSNELALSLENLKSMNDIRFSGNYYSLNSFGTTDHTEFTGVNLWNLLNEKAGISTEATQISIIAIDGYQMDFEVDQVKKQDYIDETDPYVSFPMIIAWQENGEEYDPEEGPPYKLVVGQTEAGDVNKPQWVSVIDKIIVE